MTNNKLPTKYKFNDNHVRRDFLIFYLINLSRISQKPMKFRKGLTKSVT